MADMSKVTMVLEVRFHKPSPTRDGSMEGLTIDADKDSLSLSKKYLRSEHFSRAVGVESALKKKLDKIRVPFSKDFGNPFREGTYLIPAAMLADAEALLASAKEEYDDASDKLKDAWSDVVADAKARLRSQFDEESYPSAEAMRAKFSMRWRWFQYAVPDPGSLGEFLYAREKEKVERSWKEAEESVRLALRESMAGLVGHLADQLGEKADGSKRSLRPEAVEHVNEFLDAFDKRNIFGDPGLEKLVDRARKVLDGKGVEDLKSDRGTVGTALRAVEAAIGKMIVKQKRVFDKD